MVEGENSTSKQPRPPDPRLFNKFPRNSVELRALSHEGRTSRPPRRFLVGRASSRACWKRSGRGRSSSAIDDSASSQPLGDHFTRCRSSKTIKFILKTGLPADISRRSPRVFSTLVAPASLPSSSSSSSSSFNPSTTTSHFSSKPRRRPTMQHRDAPTRRASLRPHRSRQSPRAQHRR